MSASAVGKAPLRPALRPKGAWWRRILRTVAVVFAAAVFLAGVDVLLGPVVAQVHIIIPPDAVRVSASTAVGGRTLVRRVITDPRTVADLYSRINGLPSTSGMRFSCMLAIPDPVTFVFHFTRWGGPVEDAAPVSAGCYPRQWVVN